MSTVSDTAFAVARFRALESERPAAERLFEDRFASIFYAAATPDAIAGTERLLSTPLFLDGVRLRTRFIDDFVRSGLTDGIAQVVILGAGFDARALRMPEIPERNARVYEVDFAEQLETKRSLLANAGVAQPDWLAHVACDFNDTGFEARLLADLIAKGFRQGGGALFVWEGVIAYIGADAVDRSLRFMSSAGGPGSRLAFDFAPIAFGDELAADRTRRLGFSRFEQTDYATIWRRYLSTEPHAHAAVACIGTAFV